MRRFDDANALIEKVKSIHLRVTGTDAYGTPYAASDPDLLVWVHVAEAYSFLQSHLRYRNPALSLSDQNRYYQEFARVAESLGAVNVPDSVAAVDEYLQAMRPQLRCDERTLEVVRLLQNAPAPSRLAKPVGSLMIQAGIELLPEWAATQLGISLSPSKRRSIRFATRRIAGVLRWAVRNGSWHRAMRRMGRLN